MLFLHLLFECDDFRFVHLEGSKRRVPQLAVGTRVEVQGHAVLGAFDNDVEAEIDFNVDAVGLIGVLLRSVCSHKESFQLVVNSTALC
jgi:hypothetical protein